MLASLLGSGCSLRRDPGSVLSCSGQHRKLTVRDKCNKGERCLLWELGTQSRSVQPDGNQGQGQQTPGHVTPGLLTLAIVLLAVMQPGSLCNLHMLLFAENPWKARTTATPSNWGEVGSPTRVGGRMKQRTIVSWVGFRVA